MTDPHRTFAKKLVDKGLGVPAVFVLEAMKPFSVVAQQSLYALTPFAVFGKFQNFHGQLASLFESRESMEEMMLEVQRLMEDDCE